jgi:chromosomal replication initiation ATPase DnaA
MQSDRQTGFSSEGEGPRLLLDGYDAAARRVEAIVASAFGLAPAALRGGTRGPAEIAFARQVAIYLAHTRLGFSYRDAGRCFRRDRTTARHACRHVEERREESRLDTLLDCLERAVDLLPQSAGCGARRE